jgi:hypothetical protein
MLPADLPLQGMVGVDGAEAREISRYAIKTLLILRLQTIAWAFPAILIRHGESPSRTCLSDHGYLPAVASNCWLDRIRCRPWPLFTRDVDS